MDFPSAMLVNLAAVGLRVQVLEKTVFLIYVALGFAAAVYAIYALVAVFKVRQKARKHGVGGAAGPVREVRLVHQRLPPGTRQTTQDTRFAVEQMERLLNAPEAPPREAEASRAALPRVVPFEGRQQR